MVVNAYIKAPSASDKETLLKSSSSCPPSVGVCRNKRVGAPKSRFDGNGCDIRAKLFMLVIGVSFFAYLAFYSSAIKWQQQLPQIIVRVPASDATGEPGNNAIHWKFESILNVIEFCVCTVPSEYLVYSPNCQIPALDPLADDVMKLFKQEIYKPCSPFPPLTFVRIDESTGVANIHINASLLPTYNKQKHGSIDRCCYQEIRRSGVEKEADSKFRWVV